MKRRTTPRGGLVGSRSRVHTLSHRTALLQEYTRVWKSRSERAEAWDAAVKRLHGRLQAMRSVLDAYVSKQQRS